MFSLEYRFNSNWHNIMSSSTFDGETQKLDDVQNRVWLQQLGPVFQVPVFHRTVVVVTVRLSIPVHSC